VVADDGSERFESLRDLMRVGFLDELAHGNIDAYMRGRRDLRAGIG
jgi:hypothetical protein